MNPHLVALIESNGLSATLKEVREAYSISMKDSPLYSDDDFRAIVQLDLEAIGDCILKTSMSLKERRGM